MKMSVNHPRNQYFAAGINGLDPFVSIPNTHYDSFGNRHIHLFIFERKHIGYPRLPDNQFRRCIATCKRQAHLIETAIDEKPLPNIPFPSLAICFANTIPHRESIDRNRKQFYNDSVLFNTSLQLMKEGILFEKKISTDHRTSPACPFLIRPCAS